MARFAERPVVDRQELEQDFAAVRGQGYAATIGEYDIEVAALAVHLRGEARRTAVVGHVVACVVGGAGWVGNVGVEQPHSCGRVAGVARGDRGRGDDLGVRVNRDVPL
jgi:hypothetical protein